MFSIHWRLVLGLSRLVQYRLIWRQARLCCKTY